jgi:hypothetical protein
MRRTIRVAICMAAVSLVGCGTFQQTPEPTADLQDILESLRNDIAAAEASSKERTANLSIKSASVVLKITATKTNQAGAGVEKAPIKLSYTRTTSGTLENTITLELANACTRESLEGGKDGPTTKTTCLGSTQGGVFIPGPTILTKKPGL